MIIKILIIGKSPIFIKIFREILGDFYKESDLKIKIISWRYDLDVDSNEKYDYILVSGYDYSSFLMNYKYFYKKNIIRPYVYVIRAIKYNGCIIYINTKSIKNKKYTFSRYEFSKNRLGFKLEKQNIAMVNINCETIVDEKNCYIGASYIEKYLFLIASKFHLVNTINVINLRLKIKSQIQEIKSDFISSKKGFLLGYSRPRILDRIARLL
jgi:hypothetical protein